MNTSAHRFRPGLALTLAAGIVMAILLWLAFWQLDRNDEKSALVARVIERMDSSPVALPARLDDLQSWEFRPVALQGRFLHDHERLVTSHAGNGSIGYQVFTPLARVDGPPVWIDRGWVPDALKNPGPRLSGQVEGIVTVTGLLRLPARPGWFTPEPDLAARTWFVPDIPSMSASAGLDTAIPAYVVAEDTGLDWPHPEGAQFNLRNTHLGYAITWFGIAAGLLGVYVMLGFERGRRGDRP
ncbi:MAG: SURF1 family protein [Pseudomonadota bacterium]|nr:SURF1 family protein [Pseudomonadota bacterium]